MKLPTSHLPPRLTPFLAQASVLLLAVAVSFLASFFMTSSALASGTPCGPPPYTFPCGYYYDGQSGDLSQGAYSYGVTGHIVGQAVSMHNPSVSHAINFLGITEGIPANGYPSSWVQVGTWQGLWPPGGYYSSPVGYFEYNDACDANHAVQGYLSVPQAAQIFPQIQTLNQQYWCSSIGAWTSKYQALYEWGSIGIFHLPANLGRADATTEHLNGYEGYGYMEPNGTQCFGTNSSCGVASPNQLRVNWGSGWSDWISLPTEVCPGVAGCEPSGYPTGYVGYEYLQFNPHKNFWTLGTWQ